MKRAPELFGSPLFILEARICDKRQETTGRKSYPLSLLQDSWDNAAREYVPRRRNTKNADAYRDLPETFTAKEVMAILDVEDVAAHKQCQRWLKHGFIERVKQGKYRKVIKEIMN